MLFSDSIVRTLKGPRTVVIATPDREYRVGRNRLAQLRGEVAIASIDQSVLDEIRSRDGELCAFIFRGSSDDGVGSWGYDEELTGAEATELGYLLVRSELPTYRRMLAAGAFLHIHVEWGFVELESYQDGSRRLLEELEEEAESATGERAAILAIDTWMLQHLTFFFSLPLDHVLKIVLPQQLPLLERRVPRVKALLDALPASAIK